MSLYCLENKYNMLKQSWILKNIKWMDLVGVAVKRHRYKHEYINSMMGLCVFSPFSNQRLVTKMYILDYLQFFSQETLGAPRPQSHLHEFIDSWLVPWERQRHWVENPQGSSLFSREPPGLTPTWKSSFLHKYVVVNPSPVQSSWGTEDGMMGT